MAEYKWNRQQTVLFLNIYRKHECLWDAASPEYLKKDIKEKSMKNMIDELNFAGLEVSLEPLRKKIKSIRDTYRMEVNRIKKSKNSGVEGNVYKPKLAWFSTADSFLHERTHFHRRDSSSNLDIDEQSSSFDDGNTMEEGRHFLHSLETPHLANSHQSPSEKKSLRKVLPSSLSKNYPGKISKCWKNKTDSNQFDPAINKLHYIAQITTTDAEDQFDKFGKHIAAQLRELPPKNFITLQSKIQNLLTTERLSHLEEPETFQQLLPAL